MIVYNKKHLASILFILVSFVCSATQHEAPPQPQPMGGPPPPGLPIDNGLILLFVAALIYGIYRILKHSKKPLQR